MGGLRRYCAETRLNGRGRHEGHRRVVSRRLSLAMSRGQFRGAYARARLSEQTTRARGIAEMESRSNPRHGPACPPARKLARVALLMGIAAVSVSVPAQQPGLGFPLSLDPVGVLESSSTN